MALAGWRKWVVRMLVFVIAIVLINAIAIWFNLGPVVHSAMGS